MDVIHVIGASADHHHHGGGGGGIRRLFILNKQMIVVTGSVNRLIEMLMGLIERKNELIDIVNRLEELCPFGGSLLSNRGKKGTKVTTPEMAPQPIFDQGQATSQHPESLTEFFIGGDEFSGFL